MITRPLQRCVLQEWGHIGPIFLGFSPFASRLVMRVIPLCPAHHQEIPQGQSNGASWPYIEPSKTIRQRDPFLYKLARIILLKHQELARRWDCQPGSVEVCYVRLCAWTRERSPGVSSLTSVAQLPPRLFWALSGHRANGRNSALLFKYWNLGDTWHFSKPSIICWYWVSVKKTIINNYQNIIMSINSAMQNR